MQPVGSSGKFAFVYGRKSEAPYACRLWSLLSPKFGDHTKFLYLRYVPLTETAIPGRTSFSAPRMNSSVVGDFRSGSTLLGFVGAPGLHGSMLKKAVAPQYGPKLKLISFLWAT